MNFIWLRQNNVLNNNIEFSSNDHVLIKVLRQEKGYAAKKLIAEFHNKPWTLKQIVAEKDWH